MDISATKKPFETTFFQRKVGSGQIITTVHRRLVTGKMVVKSKGSVPQIIPWKIKCQITCHPFELFFFSGGHWPAWFGQRYKPSLKFNSKFAPEKLPNPKRYFFIFQPSIFRGHVSFREGRQNYGCIMLHQFPV